MSTTTETPRPASYQHPGIRRREKHEHHDVKVFGHQFISLDPDGTVRGEANDELGTGKIVGTCTRQDPMSGRHYEAECVEVTLPDGRVVPFTRLTPDYCLVQDQSFKMAKP